MKVIELYEQLKKLINNKVINKNTKIITNSKYGYGVNIDKIKVKTKTYLQGLEIKNKPTPVVCLDIDDTYSFEYEGLGCNNMWVKEDDYYDYIL